MLAEFGQGECLDQKTLRIWLKFGRKRRGVFENNAKRKPRRWLWQIDTKDGKQNEGRGSKLNTPQSDRGPVLCFKPEVGGQPGGKPWMAEWCELLRLLWCCLDLCHLWIRVKSHPWLRAVSSHLILHSLMCFARLLSFLNQFSHFSNFEPKHACLADCHNLLDEMQKQTTKPR